MEVLAVEAEEVPNDEHTPEPPKKRSIKSILLLPIKIPIGILVTVLLGVLASIIYMVMAWIRVGSLVKFIVKGDQEQIQDFWSKLKDIDKKQFDRGRNRRK